MSRRSSSEPSQHHVAIQGMDPDPDRPDSSRRSSPVIASLRSSISLHALDIDLDRAKAATTLHLPLRGVSELDPNSPSAAQILKYADHEGENPFRKNDARPQTNRIIRRWFSTMMRARAMPWKSLSLAVLWNIAAVFITRQTSFNFAPHIAGDCRWWCSPLSIDGNALSYVGFALFLLTSFRVSEAYGRYMEAIRIWTSIGGTVTSFAKYIIQAFPPGIFHRGDRERMLGFLIAFPVTLKRQLRCERDLRELKTVLTSEDLAELQNAPSMPSHCLYILSAYCLSAQEQESRLPQTFLVHLIRWISDLAGAADTCMQIKTMPAPRSYVSHLNTFLALWLFFLPFALVETTGWLTIPIVTFISYGILGVVANAAELEDPFGGDYNDLPLGKIARGIEDDVSTIYLQSQTVQKKAVHEVDDLELKATDKYWLKQQ